jgi:kanamycin kinase
VPPELAGPPGEEVALPEAVRAVVGARPARAVWCNQVGGITFAVGEPPEAYLKWLPAGVDPAQADLDAEAARLRWARGRTPVPEVLDAGAGPDGTWLVTRALPGTSAVDPRWLADPEPAVQAIGVGLRALHDALPVEECPFDWSPEARLVHLQPRFEHRRAHLAAPPPVDRLVVCHGDACAPNTLVGADGRWVGHVDLGSLGVADRWADLAVASMSLGWNFGPGWEGPFFDAYGVTPDAERIAYHRELWDST